MLASEIRKSRKHYNYIGKYVRSRKENVVQEKKKKKPRKNPLPPKKFSVIEKEGDASSGLKLSLSIEPSHLCLIETTCYFVPSLKRAPFCGVLKGCNVIQTASSSLLWISSCPWEKGKRKNLRSILFHFRILLFVLFIKTLLCHHKLSRA